jgi:hypothetical protein
MKKNCSVDILSRTLGYTSMATILPNRMIRDLLRTKFLVVIKNFVLQVILGVRIYYRLAMAEAMSKPAYAVAAAC